MKNNTKVKIIEWISKLLGVKPNAFNNVTIPNIPVPEKYEVIISKAEYSINKNSQYDRTGSDESFINHELKYKLIEEIGKSRAIDFSERYDATNKTVIYSAEIHFLKKK